MVLADPAVSRVRRTFPLILNVKCPPCGEPQRLSEDMRGQKLTCPSCGVGFRVAAPKPAAPTDPAAPKPAPARPAAPPESRPSPASTRPDPAEAPRHGGLTPWIYGVAGGAAVGVVVAVIVAIRGLGGSGSSPAGFPDPS